MRNFETPKLLSALGDRGGVGLALATHIYYRFSAALIYTVPPLLSLLLPPLSPKFVSQSWSSVPLVSETSDQ